MSRVISAASCYEHARKQKEKGVPWGGVRMLRRCEEGKQTSGRQISGWRRAGLLGWRWDVGKVGRHVRTQSALGMGSGRWGRRGRKTTSDASGRGARASDTGLTFADAPVTVDIYRCRDFPLLFCLDLQVLFSP